MRHVRLSTLLTASALMLGVSLTAASGAWAQEVEPNNTCAAPQNLSASALPFALQGSLDTPPGTPDIDYYRFTAAPGSLIQIRLDGAPTGGGTLADPYLAVFNTSCSLLAYNDDWNGMSSGLDFTVPAGGTFVVAATSYGDWSFTGTGGSAGTYRLSLQAQAVARAVGGRLVDLETGAPLVDISVGLVRCDATGTDCHNFIGWARTDAQGAFRFENGSWSLYSPLLAGSYEISVSTPGYVAQRVPVTLVDGQDLDVGTISVEPYPTAGSISGRLVDEVSGQPLSGATAPWARVDLIHCPFWGCYTWRYGQTVGTDGTFRFTGFPNYLLPPGDFFLVAYADQYQETQSQTFHVEDDQHYDSGDVRVKSNPARVTLVQSCGAIPAEGGTCRFTMRVTNGATTRMEGESWAMVQGNDIGSSVQETTFSVGSPRALSLAPGGSVDLALSFEVPGEVSNGATVCVKGFASQRPHKFNTLGGHDLFCLRKGAGGFTQVPEAQKHDAVRRANGQAADTP